MQPSRLSSFQFRRPSSSANPRQREESATPDPLESSNPDSIRHSSLPTSSLDAVESNRSTSPSAQTTTGRQHRSSTSSAPSHIILGRTGAGQRTPAAAVKDVNPLEPLPDEEALPSSFAVLQEWNAVAADRQAKKDVMDARKKKEVHSRSLEASKDAIYKRLLLAARAPRPSAWASMLSKLRKCHPVFGPFLAGSKSENDFRTPSDNELIELAKHCYPPRFDARALVYDFGDNRTEYRTVEVGEVERWWEEKPDWAHVRWIHVPFGRGVAHSSIEDLFLHAHRVQRPYANCGELGWPFLQTETLNFRSSYDFGRMRDVYLLLRKETRLNATLDAATFGEGPKGHLKDDMQWRAGHIGTTMRYWDLVQSDMPVKLSEGGGLSEARMSNYQFCKLGPRHGLHELDPDANSEEQALSKHPYFQGSQLVRNDFRAFHGDDGFLLTMSAASGVDFLDTNFHHYLDTPRHNLFENPDATCIGRLGDRFKEPGCKNWYRKTAEWLLVYLITEIGTAPHPFNQGMVAPTLGEAYQAVVLDLNRRRYDPWQREKTVLLVRDMLACVDELNVLVGVHGKKLKLFKGLIQDCENMEAEDLRLGKAPDNAGSESAVLRANAALKLTEENYVCYVRLLSELKESLGALFQLRSIEQDELAILADKQNKAVLLFTGVTIVFLPLSFFTSYFGMNLSDLTNNERTQAYFWEVCGSIALVMVTLVLVFAFRHHIPWLAGLTKDHRKSGF